MIPRSQRVIFWILIGGILLMAALLLRGCVRTHEQIVEMRDQSPIAAPIDTPPETVTVASANDADGSITPEQITLSLPQEPSVRAHVLLDRVLADAAQPASTHPLPPGPAIADVFFVGLPIDVAPQTALGPDLPEFSRASSSVPSPYGTNHMAGAVLAVVDLTKPFADAHPSSIAAEDLTLRLMIATLHDNFPQVEEVRFLVGGQSRDTLAGHADLTRPYPVADPAAPIHVLSADGSPE